MKRLIITGDDFGLAVPVNEAIEMAHMEGVLAATSLMVGADAVDDAIERARRLPSLKVGLHIVLVEGRPVLPAESVPDLVDEHGQFRRGLVGAGIHFFFRPSVRRQIEAEIRAQFQSFQGTGLALDHVNAHNHMHLHPTVLNVIIKVGQAFGLNAVRIPYEPPLVSWRAAGLGLFPRILHTAALKPWTSIMQRRLRRAAIKTNDFVFGLNDTGAMDERLLLRFLQQLPDGITEIYFHPATRRCSEGDRTMSDYHREDELMALISPRVKQLMDKLEIQPIAFSEI